MQKERVNLLKKWLLKSVWISALVALISSPLAYGNSDFINSTFENVSKAALTPPSSDSQRSFATEFTASSLSQELLEYLQIIELSKNSPQTDSTRALKFLAIAPVNMNPNTLATSELWDYNRLALLFGNSKLSIRQHFANGIDGQISTPTNLKFVGPSSLDCELSLRMISDSTILAQLTQVEDVRHIIKKRGTPALAFAVETKNCNMVFKWVYQLALLYPTHEEQSQLIMAGRMFIKNESLQKLKLALIFSSPKKFFDQRLAQELKSFANALNLIHTDRRP